MARNGRNGKMAAQRFGIDEMENPSEYVTIFNHTLKLTDVALSLFTAALCMIGGIQAWWMKKGLDDTKSANRAFVFLKTLHTTSHYDPTAKKIFWRLVPEWENSGNTPTRNLRINVNATVRDLSLPNDFGFPLTDKTTPTLIGPKQSVFGDPVDIFGEQLNEVRQGNKYFYLWGSARYRDVFQRKEHFTKFCFAIRNVTGDPAQHYDAANNIVNIAPTQYHQHNGHDEDQ